MVTYVFKCDRMFDEIGTFDLKDYRILLKVTILLHFISYETVFDSIA